MQATANAQKPIVYQDLSLYNRMFYFKDGTPLSPIAAQFVKENR